MRTSPLIAALMLTATPALGSCARSCTAAGCSSQVSVDLTTVLTTLGSAPVTATLCVEGECRTQSVRAVETGNQRNQVWVVSPLSASMASRDALRVTLTLTRAGATLVSADASGTLSKVQPNGPQCDPTCYVALFTVQGGKLIAVAQ